MEKKLYECNEYFDKKLKYKQVMQLLRIAKKSSFFQISSGKFRLRTTSLLAFLSLLGLDNVNVSFLAESLELYEDIKNDLEKVVLENSNI